MKSNKTTRLALFPRMATRPAAQIRIETLGRFARQSESKLKRRHPETKPYTQHRFPGRYAPLRAMGYVIGPTIVCLSCAPVHTTTGPKNFKNLWCGVGDPLQGTQARPEWPESTTHSCNPVRGSKPVTTTSQVKSRTFCPVNINTRKRQAGAPLR
jgi:hypothetical protein